MKRPRPRSTILSRNGARALGYALASLSSLVVVTCAGAARGPASPRGTPVPPSPRVSTGAPASASAPAALPALEAGAGHPEALSRFRTALADLAAGRRSDSVRVLWMGDSHVAADFWPDAVRKPLQARFGVAGPGFLYLGLGVYRHAGAKVERDGVWHHEPKKPSLWTRQDDGVFGLGGIRVAPDGEACRLTIALAKDAVRGKARWDLAFRLPTDKARFRVAVDSGQTLVVDATTQAVGAIGHLEWQTEGAATVTIDRASASPQIFGAVVEGTVPGVVVDTLGINGARIGTPLAWDEEPWLAEARRRKASLFVLAYGTNEAGDEVLPRKYGPELESLILRVRKATPDADCLIVGPTDREGPGWVTLPRVLEIDAVEREAAAHAGCGFFSTISAMGGEGSLKRWAEQAPPLAARDRVHLTPRGYGELGAKMALELVPELPRPDQ
jgi:lysophospholipase L1-like esterase